MMRGAGGAVVVAVVAMLVCCSANPHQEQDANSEHNSGDQFDSSGHKTRNLDPLGGGHLIRDVRDTHSYLPYVLAKQNSAYRSGGEGGYNEHKRNFDEIDRSDLNPFLGKRNFDEIDLSSMPFPNGVKRYFTVYGGNYLDWPLEPLRSVMDKKRLRPDYPMDEIDLSHFPIGSKRAPHMHRSIRQDFPMDPIDASYFPIGSKRGMDSKLNALDRLDFEILRRQMEEMNIAQPRIPIGHRRLLSVRR